ncbi:MAG TPA: tyrosine-type recombinase/integrase [Tepidisphaeraceae bacterium]|nr:tyrosine-type recombinase/integrase [Tepidisphaeraceae bacterium]
MSTATAQPPPAQDEGFGAAIRAATDRLADLLALKPSARKELLAFVRELARPAGERFPKLPHVSFYAAGTRAGGVNYRATYRVPGYRTRTERLGRMPRPAYRRAQRVSEILQQVKARLMKPEDAFRELYVDSTPVDKHVQAFVADLKSKGRVSDYLASTETRLRRCIELGGYGRLGDIRRSTLPALTEKLKAYVEPGKKRPLTPSTINQYLGTLRQFVRWAVRTDKLALDPLQYETGIRNDSKKKRRDVLVEELAEIVASARAGTVNRLKMSGDDRAMLYLAAYATGLRRKELRALQIPWLKLDATPAVIAVPASATKTGKEARQPLPAWFAAELKAWLGDRKSGPVWPYIPQDVADMFDRDRAAARAAWVAEAPEGKEREQREQSDFLRRETTDGEIVFHSHRHAYASNLMQHLDLKTAQLLTRHATASILADTYAHSRLSRAAEGVEKSIRSPIKAEKKALAQGAAQSDVQ